MSYSRTARQVFKDLTFTYNHLRDWSDICDIGYCPPETINTRPMNRPIYEVAKEIAGQVDDTLSAYHEGLQSIVEDVLLASESAIEKLQQLGPGYLNVFNDMLEIGSEYHDGSVPAPFEPYTQILRGVSRHLHQRCEVIIMDSIDRNASEPQQNQSQGPKIICCRKIQKVLLQAFAPRPIPDEGVMETARLSAAFRQVCVEFCDLLWNEIIEDIAEQADPWIRHIDGGVRLCYCAANKLKKDEVKKQAVLTKARRGIEKAAKSRHKTSKRQQQEMSLERCRSFEEQRKRHAQGQESKTPFVVSQSPLQVYRLAEDDS